MHFVIASSFHLLFSTYKLSLSLLCVSWFEHSPGGGVTRLHANNIVSSGLMFFEEFSPLFRGWGMGSGLPFWWQT